VRYRAFPTASSGLKEVIASAIAPMSAKNLLKNIPGRKRKNGEAELRRFLEYF
jgi:hypothetical protein